MGLLALVEHRRDWIRGPETWEPRESSVMALFSSLAHHLLANFPVPPVLLSSWFLGTDWSARIRQNWFKHAGRGDSLRDAGFPIRLTRRMLHDFAHAPAMVPIEAALRWAEVRGLGGSDSLARAVASTRLAGEFADNAFWVSVFHLFINTPRLDLAHVAPVIEYLYAQKFECQQVIIGDDTELAISPPQPDLTVKGRTVESLMKRHAEWLAARTEERQRVTIRWERTGIAEYRTQCFDRTWTIRELLDSNELAAEGKAMNHCVAECYTERCFERGSSIWSMGVERPGGRERVLTIEIDPDSRALSQAKGLLNADPDETSRAVLLDWACRESLNVDEWLQVEEPWPEMVCAAAACAVEAHELAGAL